MNIINSTSFNNYRYILYLALVSFLFFSCRKNDPLNYFPKESNSLGYMKVISLEDKGKYRFGVSSVLGVEDSILNLLNILPEIASEKEFEVYYSFFNRNDYSVFINCSGLGQRLKTKMTQEKEVKNFRFKEIFNEKNSFISPLDENSILISSDMEDIRRSIKRDEEQSVLANEKIIELKKEISENTSFWMISTDSTKIASLVLPLASDSSSNFLKNIYKFKSLLFSIDGDSKLIIDGEDNNTIENIVKEFKDEAQKMNFSALSSGVPNYKFKNLEITNNNNKFRIILK